MGKKLRHPTPITRFLKSFRNSYLKEQMPSLLKLRLEFSIYILILYLPLLIDFDNKNNLIFSIII